MHIRPIKTEADHEAALARIDTLMDAGPGTPEGDELDILVTLVEAWEEKHFPFPVPDPVSAIKYTMEARGFTQTDLGKLLGSRSRASEILSGTRDISKAAMRALHTQWDIPAECLLAPRPERPGPEDGA